MARGGARPGAGRPRKPLELHRLQGTYRPSRHRNVVEMPAVAGTWAPTPDETAGLRDAGRVLLDRVQANYDVTLIEGTQLIEACRAADVLATLRAEPELDLRQIRLWSALLHRVDSRAGADMKPKVSQYAPLSAGVVAVLLDGWSARHPDYRPGDYDDFVFELMLGPESEAYRLWREHEGLLRRTAASWGWQPKWKLSTTGETVFFAETLAEKDA